METVELCTLCDQTFENEKDEIIEVKKKGLQTLINKSKLKDDNKYKLWENADSFQFHSVCRVRYQASSNKTKFKRRDKSPTLDEPSTSSRGQIHEDQIENTFNFINNCLICGKRNFHGDTGTHVFSNDHQLNRLLTTANLYNGDIFTQVHQRLQGINSLVAVKARYHKKCLYRFFADPNKEPKIREVDPDIQDTLDRVYKYIEESSETKFHLSTLQKIMGNNLITNTRLYRKLQSRYQNDIRIKQSPGTDTIIYYKHKSAGALSDDWFDNNECLDETEKKTILQAASEILRREILAKSYDTDSYRASGDFLNSIVEDIPNLLNYFLSDLLLNKKKDSDSSDFVKRDNIAHAIISSIRPKSFNSHLQLAIGTYIHKKSGSRLIIDLLSKLGVCASYYNIQLFEASTMMDPPKMVIDDVFGQYIFDNTDHNAKTLDGKRTFHCLGGIIAYTPEGNVTYEGSSKKCRKMPSAEQLAQCSCNRENRTSRGHYRPR
ncbi:uncharacterized protein LOC123269507 [Cotesia glomerata]|uniref:uncharacterized protein LOC123269507 n=1 Tax=Cotesia glomerata TaxID=32391 RepID=UPI001D024A0D|nr:uncharacterized protein LOC123269507 [Cotesia glomerata]